MGRQQAAGLAACSHRLIVAGQSRRPLLELGCLKWRFQGGAVLWEWWLRVVGDQVSAGPGKEMWSAGRVEGKAITRVMAEERAWGRRFGECDGVTGKKAAGVHVGLYTWW